ncbi:hypothetical protein PILCRDRAFT_535155 [Piloderma croceum F 1598]|uniref:Transmembrane protein n=1 Tax=Piloderma croceum (strain F 1598) TaxID=765440 RepID=A0A0C3B1N4_PILCF|nr:hypothetical protein PILCRDRAFT_535155 [Piloderma croceum F 1598]
MSLGRETSVDAVSAEGTYDGLVLFSLFGCFMFQILSLFPLTFRRRSPYRPFFLMTFDFRCPP